MNGYCYLLTLMPIFVCSILSIVLPNRAFAQEINLNRIKRLPGFKISVYATRLYVARSMVLSPQGILFVGTRKEWNIFVIMDHNNGTKADEVITIARGLNSQNGFAFKDGSRLISDDRADAMYRISYRK